MRFPSIRAGLALAVDAALLVVCLIHIPYLLDRPRPPFDLIDINDRVVVKRILDASACPDVHAGDTLVTWDAHNLTNRHEVEFFSDFASIGNHVDITAEREGKTEEKTVQLIEAHDIAYILIVLLVGIVAWGTGVFVVIRRPADRAAYLLHWSMVMMGVSVMITWGQTPIADSWMYLSRGLFFIAYAGIVAMFLHLTLWFPHQPARSLPLRGVAIHAPVNLLAVPMIYLHLRALHERSVEYFNTFHILFDIFHIVAFLYICAGIAHFIRSYVQSTSSEERKKLQWVLWGLSLGPTPFFLFTIIPQYYLGARFVPEEYTLIFLVIIPLSFGISFIKYHLLDIDVVVNRTTVYGIVLTGVITMYIVLVGILAAFVGTYTVETSTAAAVIVALLFEPARKRVQHLVDKQFFRVRYNFREALRRVSEEINMCVDAKQLADMLVARTTEIIPVERIGIFLLRQPDRRLFVLSHQGFGFLEKRTIRFQAEKLQTPLLFPVALDSSIEAGVRYESADQHMFLRWGIALVIPMRSATGEFIGFVVLGARRSGERFRMEDIDILQNLSTEAGLQFERIALQRKLIEEQAENQRLAELNRMKSDFVSNVSHELRTPLTSIRLYAEMLSAGRPSEKKLRTYLETIIGEADRLDRMVTNVLDTSKIERGAKHYLLRDADLKDIAGKVLQTMKYQLNKHGFTVIYKEPRGRLPIYADTDAVAEALMNLIDNAIKYSVTRKYLKISLGRKGGHVLCAVQDKGMGVSPDTIPLLFKRFYRDPASSNRVQGVGLGLPLVQHIMNEHGGGVTVTSFVGRGSTFTLWFPVVA